MRPDIEWVSAWSVSRLIAQRWPMPKHISDAVLERGRRIHEWTEQLDLGMEPTPPEEIAGWCKAYRRFGYSLSPSFTQVEYNFDAGSRKDGAFGWHGIADRIGVVRGKRTVLDIKSGGPQPQHPIQLAFYALGLYPQSYLKIQRLGVYLKSNGTFKVKTYSDPEDFMACHALLRQAYEEEDLTYGDDSETTTGNH